MINTSNTIEIMTYNVNYSRRAVGDYAKYSWDNRSKDVYKLINSVSPTVLFLQEVLKTNTKEVKTVLRDYELHFEPINSRDAVCQNAIGIKNTFYPGKGRLKFSFNFNKYEESAEKVMGVIVENFLFINVHFPMSERGRMSMASNFNECIPTFIDYKIVVAGDFNSFPDGNGPEQLKIFRKATNLLPITDFALSEASGQVANRSFKAYPYDVVPVDPLNRKGKLDHIFVKGLMIAEDSIPKVLDARSVEGEDFAPSDHFPLIATLTY